VTFATDHLGAAALLSVRGYKLLRLEPLPDKPHIKNFVFSDPEGTAADIVETFHSGIAMVQAVAYDRCIARMKHLLRNGGAR